MEYYIFSDSTNRDESIYPHGNSYTLHLTHPLKNVACVDLVAAKVPNTLFNLSKQSNIIINTTEYTVPPGFYSACGASDSFSSLTGLGVSYLSNEGKFLFTNGDRFTIRIEDPDLQRLTGISNTTSSFNSSLGLFAVKSSKIIDLSTNEFVFLDIDELRNQRVVDSKKIVGDSFDGATIATSFSMIPLDVPSGTVKTFKETTDYKVSIHFDHPIPKISRLTVRWLDQTGKVLDFNGVNNNSFLLRFHCVPSAPPEPPKESEYEVLAQKIERAIQDVIPPPKPEKTKPWLVPVLIAMALIIVYLYKFRPS